MFSNFTYCYHNTSVGVVKKMFLSNSCSITSSDRR